MEIQTAIANSYAKAAENIPLDLRLCGRIISSDEGECSSSLPFREFTQGDTNRSSRAKETN